MGLPDSPSSCTRSPSGRRNRILREEKTDVEILGIRVVVMYWIPLRILQGHIPTAGVRRFSASVFFFYYSFSIVVRADVELLVLTVGEM